MDEAFELLDRVKLGPSGDPKDIVGWNAECAKARDVPKDKFGA